MLKNKRGDGYIQACVMILILCMLIAVCLTFVTTVNTIRVVERNARIVLDSFVMENSIIIYDSIKNGHDFTDVVDSTEYWKQMAEYSALSFDGLDLYRYDADGNWDYRITARSMTMTQTNSLQIAANYTITIPIYFAGVMVTRVSIPVTVESKWTDKF